MPRKPNLTDKYQPRKSKTNWSRILIVGLLGLALVGFILQSIPSSNRSQTMEPAFIDMGDLQLSDGETGEVIAVIDIEIASTPDQTAKGLMWRRSMAENQGMLFLMPTLEPQSFWMLNTYIPLDILYVNEDKEIVSIAENATPQSTDPIHSGAPALYVLELNAGFVQRHGIKVGDRLAWTSDY